MQSSAKTVNEYLENLPSERIEAMTKLRDTILKNLPKGFVEQMSYGMIGYIVPHSIFPAGYHVNPKLPLPFVNIASQKNFIALYHLGLYGNPKLLESFINEYPKYSKSKLDMGKGCIRFKKPENIPYPLIGELIKKIPVADWITQYQNNLRMTK